MPLTHSQTPVHVCVCLWREFVWSSQLVCISVWQRLCVCVCVWLCGQCVTAGQPLNRPPAALKHWNSLPCSFFFFFFSNMLPASLSSHEIGPSLARSDCLHCKWLLWSLPRGRRGPIQGQKRYKRRLTDPTLPPCPCSPSEPHQQVLLLVYAQVKSNPSQLMRTITMTYKINILLDCSVLFTLSYHPPLPGLLCKQWWCGAMTPVL